MSKWKLVPVVPTPEMGAVFKRFQIGRCEWNVMLAAAPEPDVEPDGLPLVIAGAIFDFAGYLTTRDKVIKVGSTANASPIADLVKEWADVRGLSLTDAAVLSWQEWLHTAPQAPRRLTDEEVRTIVGNVADIGGSIRIARAIEARILGEQT